MMCITISGDGTTCPICGTRNIELLNGDGCHDNMWENMVCHECRSTWVNHWKFNGQSDIVEGVK